MRIIGWLFTILLIIFGVGFAALNATPVLVNYVIGKHEMPLAVIIFISFGVGILVSMLILGAKILSLTAKNKWLSNKLKKQEEKLNNPELS